MSPREVAREALGAVAFFAVCYVVWIWCFVLL